MQVSLFKRLLIYQKERFPLLVHIPLIAAFSFSVIGYSRACREVEGFISIRDYLFCVLTNICIFFMLRVADEHKDKDDDAMYRKYLPVPRGLISLKELRVIGWLLFGVSLTINVGMYPVLLPIYAFVMLYLTLMRYEFFIAAWLKKRQIWYIATHMMIIPLADVYASSYDWRLSGTVAPVGLLYFFGVSFLNGIILEVGRKLRVQETEEPGVLSYTRLWGIKGAGFIWMALLIMNFLLAFVAANEIDAPQGVLLSLSVLFMVALIPAVLFLLKPHKQLTKLIEIISLVWALGMYILLGITPLILQLTT